MRDDTLQMRGAKPAPAARRNQTYGSGRTCEAPGCATRLSIYNRSKFCWQHEPVRAYVPRGKRKPRQAA